MGEVQNSDEEITTQIRELLDWDIRVHSDLVAIRTYDRVVHLSGTVGSAAEKARVVATASQAGARRVDARDLLGAYWALSPALRSHKCADRSDEDIAAHVIPDPYISRSIEAKSFVRRLPGAVAGG